MKRLVLVIDDSATVRREVVSALEGFEVLEAADGLEGAALLEERADIALAICDVNMPNMTGIEMLERLQGRLVEEGPPILMLTTEGQPTMIKRARELGARGWIVKPFHSQQLLAAARKLTGTG